MNQELWRGACGCTWTAAEIAAGKPCKNGCEAPRPVPAREVQVTRRPDPQCSVCCGTGLVRVPTTKPFDLQFECECVTPVPTEADLDELEARRCAEWAVIFGD